MSTNNIQTQHNLDNGSWQSMSLPFLSRRKKNMTIFYRNVAMLHGSWIVRERKEYKHNAQFIGEAQIVHP
jgi:hypothetical protein